MSTPSVAARRPIEDDSGNPSLLLMRLALVISSLAGGGAERTMAALANAWVAEGRQVTLITLALRTEDTYALRSDVVRVDLGLKGDSRNALGSLVATVRRARALRGALCESRADAVVSFMTTTNLLVLIATIGLHVPVIISERVFIAMQPPRWPLRRLYRLLYSRAAAIVAQTRRGAADLEARVGRPAHVIPNWVAPGREASAPRSVDLRIGSPRQEAGAHLMVAVGRLDPQKGFDLLIEAFARVASRYPSWRLVILGEGAARTELTSLIAARRLAARVSLPGFIAEPRAIMRQADLFVLSSRFEGMPNALIEAMSEGRACVSFDCPTGPAELIEHSINGWLVPAGDVDALSAALADLMGDSGLRERLGGRARAIADAYSQRSIMGLWNSLLASVTGDSAQD
jgi:GalNAc-alpha-(1->4)-GalNAc-alpha-(1->3)-diNAcBac-PP-undecaprenol alpha-1,4-N-acetyl-D-galactosaminyltransferase